MKVLVVGGSGLIGGDAALYLDGQGHDVTIMSRRAPETPALAALSFLQGDYINDNVDDGRLQGFDWLVFAAAADIRNVPVDGSITAEAFYKKANDQAVPAFFKAARDAGVSRALYIGSFYSEVAPHRIAECPYVASRYNTDVAVRALGSEVFNVCSLAAPFVMGHIPGQEIPYLKALVRYARGDIPGLPVFAPPGGSNHMTSRSIAVAVLGGLERGESGKVYLIGDENYSWKDYLEMWFAAAGNPVTLEVREDDHPIFPSSIILAGAGATVQYQPDARESALLGYPREQVRAMVAELIEAYS